MKVEDWGEIEYAEALARQQELLQLVIDKKRPETLVLCSHPSVVTLGKKSTPADVLGWQGAVFPVQRGGKATYHGPGQVVVYPFIDLSSRNRDIYKYLRDLEQAMVETLGNFGITAEGHEAQATGVWVQQKKVASIGIAVKRWVTYHGLAINLDKDPLGFQGIRACGFGQEIMTSVEEILFKKIDRTLFRNCLVEKLLAKL